MEKYIPDIYQKSIYTIDYSKLWLMGIKCLLFDLDNTLVPASINEPTKKNIELFNELKELGFKVIIFSNAHKKRIKPFKDALEVDCSANSMKPLKRKFLKVLDEYNYNLNEVAIIGDQILTDILGGNNVGITTVLINPISKKDAVVTNLNRLLEKLIMKYLRKKNLFTKGKYYD
jgi:uncharacterized protein